MKFLNFLKPKPAQPTIESYGQQSCGVPQEQIQSLMEWLFASLLNAGYSGKSHLIWYDSDNPDSSLEQKVKKVVRSGEPIFLYRCGGRVSSPPKGYYWRMMDEYPSMRIYQLEVNEVWEQREKVRSGFGSQLRLYIVNKTWFFSCDRILKQVIYVPGFSTSQNRVAPMKYDVTYKNQYQAIKQLAEKFFRDENQCVEKLHNKSRQKFP